jgi:hypothetical protein
VSWPGCQDTGAGPHRPNRTRCCSPPRRCCPGRRQPVRHDRADARPGRRRLHQHPHPVRRLHPWHACLR